MVLRQWEKVLFCGKEATVWAIRIHRMMHGNHYIFIPILSYCFFKMKSKIFTTFNFEETLRKYNGTSFLNFLTGSIVMMGSDLQMYLSKPVLSTKPGD